MIRHSICRSLLVVLAVTSQVRSEVTYTEADARTSDSLTLIRMTVTPAAEPVPALKHRLITRDIDLKPGNAVPYYYRAMIDSASVMRSFQEKFSEEDELLRWYGTGTNATPIEELPLKKVRQANGMLHSVLDQYLADAVVRRDCDWQLGVEEERGIDVVSFLLPEFQQGRNLARMLSLRTRLAIAERRYDDALASMRMNCRLGRDVAKPPFLVCGLIGIAIEGMIGGTLIDFVAAPGSPNLYWALAELPEPLIDLRPAVQFEMDFGARMFPFIHHAESTEHARQEWNRLFAAALNDSRKIGGRVALLGEGPADNEAGAGIVATAVALLGYPHAKQQLIAQGMDRDRVEAMAVGQVMAVYTERNYRRFADGYEKLWYMPYWQMRKRLGEIEDELSDAGLLSGSENREVMPIVSSLLPAIHAARAAQVRLERDVAALRVIEALRMYAAEHDRRLPETLKGIEQVPVPTNPATGKPFVYRLDGQTAILELPSSDGIVGYNRRFEIQIAEETKE